MRLVGRRQSIQRVMGSCFKKFGRRCGIDQVGAVFTGCKMAQPVMSRTSISTSCWTSFLAASSPGGQSSFGRRTPLVSTRSTSQSGGTCRTKSIESSLQTWKNSWRRWKMWRRRFPKKWFARQQQMSANVAKPVYWPAGDILNIFYVEC